MPRKKTLPPPAISRPDERRSVTFAPESLRDLKRLSEAAADEARRSVSQSAVIRALIRHAAGQPPKWVRDVLCSFIDAEVVAGVKWGHESMKFFTE